MTARDPSGNRGILMLIAEASCTPPQTVKCIEYFIHLGAQPNQTDECGDTAAHLAARTDHLRLLALMPFSVKWQANRRGLTPLMEASRAGCWACAKHLLHLLRQARHARVGQRRIELLKMRDGCGRTALDLAVHGGHAELAAVIEREMRLVVSTNGLGSIKGLSVAEMDARDHLEQLIESFNWPGLLRAVSRVNCDLPDRDGWTPAMRAFKSTGCPSATLRRLAVISDVTCSNVWGVSCLHRAASAGASPENLAILLEHGAPVDTPDEDNKTPLMLLAEADAAAASRIINSARSLLSGGANWSLCRHPSRLRQRPVHARDNNELTQLLQTYQSKNYFDESLKMSCCRDSLRCLAAESLGRQRFWRQMTDSRLPPLLAAFVSRHVAGCLGCVCCCADDAESPASDT